MPATTSFIRVTTDKSIPVRIFVNRSKLLENASVISVNEKSIVKLQKINILKLSNGDINSLIGTIRRELVDVLTNKPIGKLLEENILRNNRIVIDINKHEWKCYMNISVDFLVNLRLNIGRLTKDDIEHISKRKGSNFSVSLLVKTSNFSFEEEKKLTKYKIRKSNLVSGFHDGLDLYVYDRPNK